MLRKELNTTSVQCQIKALEIDIQAKIGDIVLENNVNSDLDLSLIPINDLIELNFLCQDNGAAPLNWDPLEP